MPNCSEKLLLKGPDGRTYLGKLCDNGWHIREFSSMGSPSDWWINKSTNQWCRSLTCTNLKEFKIMAAKAIKENPLSVKLLEGPDGLKYRAYRYPDQYWCSNIWGNGWLVEPFRTSPYMGYFAQESSQWWIDQRDLFYGSDYFKGPGVVYQKLDGFKVLAETYGKVKIG